MKQLLVLSAALGLAAVFAGCGGGVDSVQPGQRNTPTINGNSPTAGGAVVAAETATASELDYQGWKGLRMQNGLVEVVCVPAIGGRIMSYSMAGHNALWNNPEEFGKTYPVAKSETERKWHNFGGYKVWPAPQTEWKGPPDPVGSSLEGAPWEGKITNASGVYSEITMTSPMDKGVTGLQMTRRVRLYAGTTKVQVRETFKNVSDKPVRWSIWEVTQVPGSLEKDKEFSPESKVYIPLNPESKMKGGFVHLVQTPKDTEQFKTIAGGKVVETSYQHLMDKIGADSVAGWAAAVDGVAGFAMVKRFEVEKAREYPDNGSTVENWTNPDFAYQELEVLSPIHDIAPGKEVAFEETWYTAKLAGQITEVTDAAAITTPITVAMKDGEAAITGEFGVFAPGKLKIAFMDAKNHAVGDVESMSVEPMTLVKLDKKIKLPAGAVKLAVKVQDAKEKLVGMVAEVKLETTTAAATAAVPAAGAQATK